MSVERRPEQEALDRLILEMRNEASPDLDWDRVEARLLREPKPVPQSAFAQVLGRLRLPAAGLVAVGAVAAAVLMHRPAPVPGELVAKVSTQPLDGDHLAVGTHLTAGAHALVVKHAGRAQWTLEPHASASVTDVGEFLTLELVSGALSARVVPNPKPETFAVESGGTRVAVHGTAFRVERAGERVLVEVSEGTVAVEPKGSHSSPAFLLRRDSRGNFALDGHTGTVEGNASAVVQDGATRSRREVANNSAHAPLPRPAKSGAVPSPAGANPASAPATNGAAATLPVQPSISDIEAGVSSAIVLMNGCFHDKTHSGGNRVSASTGVTLAVSPDGSVHSVTFAPPLAPAVEDCAVTGLRTLTFASSREGVTFTRVVELSR